MSRRRSNRRTRPQPNTALREGVYDALLDGSGVDVDDWMYRSLTGGNRGNNLPEFKHEKALSIAQYLYRTNPVANRLVSMLCDFVMGEGVTYSCLNETVRLVIKAHWKDHYNDWDRYGPELFTSFLVFGELFLPLFPNPQDGHMRVGVMLPDRIRRVSTDPENWRVAQTVQLKSATGGDEGETYTVVNLRDGADTLNATKPALFWKRSNPFGSRGMSILYPVADFIDLLDQIAFSEVERWLMQKAFVWDVSVAGMDASQLAKFKKDNPELSTPPKPGSVFVHNDGVGMTAISPTLNTVDSVNGMRFLRNHILGAVGIPEHWFGEGGDVNRSVGTVMAEVPRKRFTALQDEWRFIMQDVVQAQIDYAVQAGTLPAMVAVQDSQGNDTAEMIAAREAFTIQMPDLSADDVIKVTQSMQQLTSTLVMAEAEAYVSRDTARKAFLSLLQQVGVDLDPDEEAARAEAEDIARQAKQAQFAQTMQPPTQLAALAPRAQRPGDQQPGAVVAVKQAGD